MRCHWSSSASLLPSPLSSRFRPQNPPPFVPQRLTKTAAMRLAVVSSLPLGVDDVADLARNKVLVAAAVAGTIGQLAKPLTSAIRGKGIDLRAAVRAGGMPSTHSSAVTAAATLLGLERGFSDSIFGMSVVFAALVMYDAQGVRREVGIHAKILNRIQNSHAEDDYRNNKLKSSSINCKEKSPVPSISDKEDAYGSNSESYSFQRPATTSTELKISKLDTKEPIHMKQYSLSELNESVGHTEIQVIAGAILGLVVGLATELVLSGRLTGGERQALGVSRQIGSEPANAMASRVRSISPNPSSLLRPPSPSVSRELGPPPAASQRCVLGILEVVVPRRVLSVLG